MYEQDDQSFDQIFIHFTISNVIVFNYCLVKRALAAPPNAT